MAQPKLLAHKVIDMTITLTTTGWSDNQQVVSIEDMLANSIVWIQPDSSAALAYASANCRAIDQAKGTLTFACDTVPTATLSVQIVIINGNTSSGSASGEGGTVTDTVSLNLNSSTGTVSAVSGSGDTITELSLPTYEGRTIIPTETAQVAVPAGRFTLGAVTVAGAQLAEEGSDEPPTIIVSSSGLITAKDNADRTATQQLATVDGRTITPNEEEQVAAEANVFTLGQILVGAVKAEESVGYIHVQYPAGSTCTCSNGSTVYTAGNTSGLWMFSVPRAGTWTVSCANGIQSRSQNVSISYTGQAASVTLSYIQYLFKSGTGALVDWTATGYSGLSKCTITNEYIQGNANYGYYYPGFGTRDAIDLTGYTTLHCTARAYNTAAYAAIKMTLAVQNPINTTVSSTQASSADYSTFTLDVSKLDGGHYIVLYENYDYNATIIATDIWLT